MGFCTGTGNKLIGGVNDMEGKNWRFCSQEDETISLHDCVIDCVEWAEHGIWLSFENGFNVTKDNSLNPTGRHRLTGKAAVFFYNSVPAEDPQQRHLGMTLNFFTAFIQTKAEQMLKQV